MSAPVAFKCPNCASPIRAEDWDQDTGIIRCSYCRALSTVPVSNEAARKARAVNLVRAPVPLPPGIHVEESALGLFIRRRWFSWIVLFLVPFCIAWDGFIIFWYTTVMREGAPWIAIVFPIVHVAAGVGITYLTLSVLFNCTYISVAGGRLRIRHSPLPWGGNMDLDTSEVAQLYCKERVHRGKNGTSYSYELWALFHNEKSRKLLGTSMKEEQALYVEQKLEQAMGIKDKPIAGEIRR